MADTKILCVHGIGHAEEDPHWNQPWIDVITDAFKRCNNPEPPQFAVVGKLHRTRRNGVVFDLAPLPHPSGASTWQHVEPGKTLLRQALALIATHPSWRSLQKNGR